MVGFPPVDDTALGTQRASCSLELSSWRSSVCTFCSSPPWETNDCFTRSAHVCFYDHEKKDIEWFSSVNTIRLSTRSNKKTMVALYLKCGDDSNDVVNDLPRCFACCFLPALYFFFFFAPSSNHKLSPWGRAQEGQSLDHRVKWSEAFQNLLEMHTNRTSTAVQCLDNRLTFSVRHDEPMRPDPAKHDSRQGSRLSRRRPLQVALSLPGRFECCPDGASSPSIFWKRNQVGDRGAENRAPLLSDAHCVARFAYLVQIDRTSA